MKKVIFMALLAIVCVTLNSFTKPGEAINFHNRSWDPNVRMQVRIGMNSNPESNPQYGEFAIPKGGSQAIPWNGQNIWYRREANPVQHDGRWGSWSCVFSNIAHDIDLN